MDHPASPQTFSESTTPVELAQQDSWAVPLEGGPVTSDGLQKDGILYFGHGERVQTLHQRDGSSGPSYALPPGIQLPVSLIAEAWGGLVVAAGRNVCVLTPGLGMRKIYEADSDSYRPDTRVKWMRARGGNLLVCSSQSLSLIDRNGLELQRMYLSSEDNLIGSEPLVLDSRLYYVDEYSDHSWSILRSVQLDTWQQDDSEAEWSGHSDNALTTDGACVYRSATGGGRNSLQGYATPDKRARWGQPLVPKSTVTTTVVPFGTELYFCGGKTLFIVRKSDGKGVKTVDLPESVHGPLRLIAGILYGLGDTGIFAYNPLDGNLVHASLGSFPRWLGHHAETLYLAGGGQARSMNLAAITRAFDLEVELVQDYRVTPGEAPVPFSSYQVGLKLRDTNHVARTEELVHVWAVTSTTASLNGQQVVLGPEQPVVTRTDLSGAVRLALEATELSAPLVELWSPFMAPQERVVVSPDRAAHAKLADITGEELAEATDFSGTRILKEEFRTDPKSAENLATAINNTMSLTNAPSSRRTMVAKYLTARSVARGAVTVSLADRDQPPEPLQTSSSWSLDLSGAGATYSPMNEEQIKQWIDENQQYTKPSSRRSMSGYWEKMKNGGAKLLSVVVYAAQTVAEAAVAACRLLIDEVEQTVELAIDTLEQAVVLVQAVFNTVATGIQNVVQALSTLFDLKKIEEMNQRLQAQILDGLDRLAADEGGHLATAKAFVDANLGDLQQQLKGAFGALRAGFGDLSFNSTSFAGAPDARSATPQAQGSGAGQTWLLDKLRDVLNAESLMADIHFPVFAPGAALRAAFEKVRRDAVGHLSDTLLETLEQNLAAFQAITPSQFLSGTVSAFLTVIEGLLELVVTGAKVLVDGIFELIPALLTELAAFLRTRFRLPVLSDLFGGDLCALDLMTLPMAVPLTLAEAVTARRGINTDLGTASTSLGTAFGVWAFLDALIEIFAPPKPDDPPTVPTWLRDKWNACRGVISAVGRVTILVLVWAECIDHAQNRSGQDGSVPMEFMGLLVFTILQGADVFWSAITHTDARDSWQGQLILLLLGLMGFLLMGVVLLGVGEIGMAHVWGLVVFGSEFALAILGILRTFRTPPWAMALLEFAMHMAACIVTFLDGFGKLARRAGAEVPELAVLRAPATSPVFHLAQPGSYHAVRLRYAVSFFDDAAETPRGSWSKEHDLGAVAAVTVSDLPVDPSGLARGRRIYRLEGTSGVQLVGQVLDNTSTGFVDTRWAG